MISYHAGLFGFELLFRYHGSALYKSIPLTILSTIIYIILWYTTDLDDDGNSKHVYRRILLHPDAVGVVITGLMFLLQIRSNFAYGRYWDSMSAVHIFHGKLIDYGAEVAAFHLQAKQYDACRPPSYGSFPNLQEIVHPRVRERNKTPHHPTTASLHFDTVPSEQTTLMDRIHPVRKKITDQWSKSTHGSFRSWSSWNKKSNSANNLPDVPQQHQKQHEEGGGDEQQHQQQHQFQSSQVPAKPHSPIPHQQQSSEPNDSNHREDTTPKAHLGVFGSVHSPLFKKLGRTDSNVEASTTAKKNRVLRKLFSSLSHDHDDDAATSVKADTATTTANTSTPTTTSHKKLPPGLSRENLMNDAPGTMYNIISASSKRRRNKKSKSTGPGSPTREDDAIMSHSVHNNTAAKKLGMNEKPSLFLQEAAHLLSLLSAVALSTLRNDAEGTQSPLIEFTPNQPFPHVDPDSYSADVRKDWDIIVSSKFRFVRIFYYMFGLDCTAKTRVLYNAARPFRVIGNVSDDEVAMLQTARGPFAKVSLVNMWLNEFIARESLNGSLGPVDPPILSRLWQLNSDAMVGYNTARMNSYIPFPFPIAQISSVFVVIVVGFIPTLMLSYVHNPVLGLFLNLITVLCFTGLHEVARELEIPFRNTPNDIPLNNYQGQFNESLMTMYYGYHPDSFWELSSIHTTNTSTETEKPQPTTADIPKLATTTTDPPLSTASPEVTDVRVDATVVVPSTHLSSVSSSNTTLQTTNNSGLTNPTIPTPATDNPQAADH